MSISEEFDLENKINNFITILEKFWEKNIKKFYLWLYKIIAKPEFTLGSET
jgi:hypothetical protein